MRYPTSIRSAIVAVVPLLAGIGLSAQTVFGAGLEPLQPLQPPIIQPVQSLQSPVTTFNGTYKSPNGHFTFSLTDNGIVLAGPGGSVRIDETSVQVTSPGNITVTGSAVTVAASARTQLIGSMVTLNGSCAPVAHANDVVLVNVPFMATSGTGTIIGGSPTVRVC